MTIYNQSDVSIVINNGSLQWGKFYASPDKNKEIKINALNGTAISPNSSYTLGACGRENNTSGCEGSFELQEVDRSTISRIFFYSPHGTSYNQFRAEANQPQKWAVSQSGGYYGNNAPLGAVIVYLKHF